MAKYGMFSVSKFARLAKMTRDILLNYDRLGLISPFTRGKNNYRYYSSDQLAIAAVIRTQLELGTTLAKIKRKVDRRTPDSTAEALALQLNQLELKIEDLSRTRKLVATLLKSIRSVQGVDGRAITVEFLPEETILMGEANDFTGGKSDYDALHNFYDEVVERYPEVNLSFPVWAMFSGERVKRGDWSLPDRYYFYNPDGEDKRPAGQYAVAYTRGGYGQAGDAYERLLAHIDANGLEICGDAYEEYPLNEVSVSDETNYLIRVMIAVRDKKRR